MEYYAPIWSPYLVKDIQVLEKVQKWATKLVKGYEKSPYKQRLRSLDIYTLSGLCQHGDLIEVLKIYNGYYNININQVFITSDVTSTRGHSMKLLNHTPGEQEAGGQKGHRPLNFCKGGLVPAEIEIVKF